MPFVKTERQVEAIDVLNDHRHGLLFGGSRSGKTFIIIRNIFLRAVKKTSKHLMTRFRYNHARVSLAHETVPVVLEKCFPGLPVQENKADGYWTVPSSDGGESQVWLGGTDDQERIEKILGNEYCVDPDARILTMDLRWVRAGDLKIDQELIGFDEEPGKGRGIGQRRLRASKVTRSDVISAKRVRVWTNSGNTTVSARHLFLVRCGTEWRYEWKAAEDLRSGDSVKFLAEPWDPDATRDGGWLAGIFDGEGCVTGQVGSKGGGPRVLVSQKPGIVLDEVRRVLDSFDVPFTEHGLKSGVRSLAIGRKSAAMRLIGKVRPVRLLTKSRALWEGTKVATRSCPDVIVSKTENLGEGPVVALGTTTKTFIADGFMCHNSTIYANECSQIPFDAIVLLWTRLAETSGLERRFYYDCNPPGKKHWTHLMFFEGKLPDDLTHDLDVGNLRVNPIHNVENLPPEYLAALGMLPKRQRQRFLEGLYLDDVEGALWNDRLINAAKLKRPAPFRKTVVAVDPSVSNNPKSDECGIVLASLDEEREGVIREDFSLKASTRRWAQRVVNVYETYEANEIVAEVNQGGDLVEDAIHNINPRIKVHKVHAATGKIARAEPVAMLYEQGKVSHVKSMPELESELTETVLDEVRRSPNRLDALVWALHHLMIGKTTKRIHVG